MASKYEIHEGTATYGNHVEVARRVGANQWYSRVMENTRYGLAWSKWRKHTPTYVSQVPGLDGSIITLKAPAMVWGWNKLDPMRLTDSIRLPKE